MNFICVSPNADVKEIHEELKNVGNLVNNYLYQICYLIEVRGKYYILHYKECFSLYDFIAFKVINRHKIKMIDEDIGKRNFIIKYLLDKNLLLLNDVAYNYINNGIKYDCDVVDDRDVIRIAKFKI
jgi:hypothetical protein